MPQLVDTDRFDEALIPFADLMQEDRLVEAFAFLGTYLSLPGIRAIPEGGASFIMTHTVEQTIRDHQN